MAKVGVVRPVKSWVNLSSSRSLSPGTPMILTAMLMIPMPSTSGGASGAPEAKRTQAGYVRGAAKMPRHRWAGTLSFTSKVARTAPYVLVLPARNATSWPV